jgi:hypothetical protein
MSKLSNCERDSLKSFINILKAYALDQQRESNIGVVESFRSKTKKLAYQPEPGGHLRVAKKELQELKVNQQNLNSGVDIENIQQLEHQGRDRNSRFKCGCKGTTKKACNRPTLQPKVQEAFMLPLGAKFHNL